LNGSCCCLCVEAFLFDSEQLFLRLLLCVIDDVGKVTSLVYLGDKLDAGGGCLSVVTARVRVGLGKFREFSVGRSGR
jgi:hypothetical protein